METEKIYKMIQGFVHKNLLKSLHERHFEDAVQHVAMEYFAGNTNFRWTFLGYCRINGLGKTSNLGARSIESAVSLDAQTKDTGENSYYLANSVAIHCEEVEGIIEDLLAPLNLKRETREWAVRTYKFRPSRHKSSS